MERRAPIYLAQSLALALALGALAGCKAKTPEPPATRDAWSAVFAYLPPGHSIGYTFQSDASGHHALCGYIIKDRTKDDPTPFNPADRFVYVDGKLTLYSKSDHDAFEALSHRACPGMVEPLQVPLVP